MNTRLRPVMLACLLVTATVGAIFLSRLKGDPALPLSNEPRGRITFTGSCDLPCREPAEIFTVRADGGSSQRRLVQGAQPAWSTNGSRLAFVDGAGRGLRVTNADGTDVIRLTSCESPTCEVHLSPTWSPDGERVAFVVQRPGGNPVRSELAVVTVGGGNVQTLLACPEDGCRSIFQPAWSPDGKRISFWDIQYDGEGIISTLRVLQLSTGRLRTLYECPRCGGVGGPSWSPDGGAMVIDRGRDLFSIDASSGQMQRVTDCRTEPPCIDEHPAWSPDGGWIVFSRLVDEEASLELFLVQPDGSGLRPLDVEGMFPSWQPLT